MPRRGASMLELIVWAAVLGAFLLVAAPQILNVRRGAAVASAAREFGVLFRSLRHRAVAEARAYGVVFMQQEGRWSYAVARDGDGDGMRTKDLARGIDPIVAGPWVVEERWPTVRLGVPGIEDPRSPPPSKRRLKGTDPVRFGRSDIVSFTPLGASTSGTLYLRSGECCWAIVVYGPTVRVRFWELRGAGWARR